MSTIKGPALDISNGLNGHLSVNSAGNEIACGDDLHTKFLPDGMTAEMLQRAQAYRNEFTAGMGHAASGVMMEHWKANPGDGQITASVPFGMDTFKMVGTMQDGVPNFVTAYVTNGAEPMYDLHQHLNSLAASIASK